MKHNYSCPHDCSVCTPKSRWNMGIWKNGGCAVCSEILGDRAWACDRCWNKLPEKDKTELRNACLKAREA